ncbi:DUF4224 domain-containing protein [Pectobacterium aroidearum]|uniref:DUF4224 domain-containing protein n=2 Tax=Pectobacterium TaxID=122277 RepID=A0ABR5ZAT1_9GAMM|nr:MULTISPECIES: DUF4224 domain-containing protein [Pectobacterium]MBA5198895.1 DUF4224 domain-containing protein [Pectobacterium aroidearum]MBA5231687.1 DUF4224 domain-containing protein [Pectobacterium aroidearum]MBA5736865.1 DUF4224 domain-containing protein [Pectobacterium aroidearum]UXJ98923.1 DUF4224 domain-containing protein [Pectobacterium aroidearum]GKV93558.1 hypothetical protein PEC301645_10050 [Pectobacterium carotovorum subsp. carotovorum]
MTDLLTDDELIELTGYKYASKQRAALTRSGISFITRRDGRPSVTWAAINASLSAAKAEQFKVVEQPNFDAI